jgi:hypothetical protein
MQPSPTGKAVASTRTGMFTWARAPQRCSSPFGLYDMKHFPFSCKCRSSSAPIRAASLQYGGRQVGTEQLGKFASFNGFLKIVTLSLCTISSLQGKKLIPCFHALGDDL